MLTRRKLPLLTCEQYREVFSFPVKDYYSKIGFDFTSEDWDEAAHEYVNQYTHLLPESHIFPQAHKLLKMFRSEGKKQFILSAMEHDMLHKSANDENIADFFEEILGINNIFASSKIQNGIELIKKHNLLPHEICLLGDTTHDYEVAQELGCQCVLIAGGHQSHSRLRQTGCKWVIDSLEEINHETTIDTKNIIIN